jgi:hypothetical protein
MKKITFSTVLFFINFCLLFSQHEVKLKSGETIKGEVKTLLNGQLTVLFKGNNLNLMLSDIENISFVKSSQSSASFNSDKGELKGVVTYYFNRNIGDKPDVGSTVIIHKTDSINGSKSAIGDYQNAQLYRSLIALGAKSKDDEYNKKLKELNADTKEGFKQLDEKSFKEYLGLKNPEKKSLELTVDGSGNYSVKLEPGIYEVVIISKGRSGSTMSELLGKIYRKLVTIKSGEVCTLDNSFGVN